MLTALITASCLAASSFVLRDADTLKLDNGQRYRIAGLDAPETFRPKCFDELMLGTDATHHGQKLVKEAKCITVTDTGKTTPDGLPLVDVSLDGQDYTGLMVAAGHGVTWTGQKHEWCNTQKD